MMLHLARRLGFEAEATRALDEYRRTGEYYALDEVRAYLLARARGEDPPKPPLRTDAVLAQTRPQG